MHFNIETISKGCYDKTRCFYELIFYELNFDEVN